VYSFFYKITFFVKIIFYFSDKIYTNIYNKLFNYTNIFINYYFYKFYILNDKFNYIFNYILIKKQNSFLKKKINLFNNFYVMSQKNTKNFDKKNDKKNELNYFINYYKVTNDLFVELDAQKLVDLKKKLKKTILENRKILKKITFNKATRSHNISKFINIFGKKKI
jgi:hypothetical protein